MAYDAGLCERVRDVINDRPGHLDIDLPGVRGDVAAQGAEVSV